MPSSSRTGLVLAATSILMVFITMANAQVGVDPTNLPNPYSTIENWGKLPEGRPWGSTNAIEVDRDNHVWVVDRCGANTCLGSDLSPVLEFDPAGKLLTSFGRGLFLLPHGLCMDPDGSVWVTDSGPFGDTATQGRGFQVFKFSREGKVLMTLGTAGVSKAGTDTFIGPTDCVIADNGDIFVTDGHVPRGADAQQDGDRVVKFSKAGKFMRAFGKKGSAPGEFDDPHGITLDSRGRLFVADRGNNRVQILDQEGRLLDQWKQFGRPSGVAISKNDTIFVADSSSNLKVAGILRNPGWKNGIRVGSARDGSLTAFIGWPEPAPVPEGVAVDAAGNLYGARVSKKGVEKYIRR